MKKILVAILSIAMACGIGFAAMGCSEKGDIAKYTREEGSGTRDAFMELAGIETMSDEAAVSQGTDALMTAVAGNKKAIGYVSLGSVNSTVKKVKIENVEATAENIIAGTYKLSRPFNVAYKQATLDSNETLQELMEFIYSKEGQTIVSEDYVSETLETAPAYTVPETAPTASVKISGSTSVTPLMEKLVEAFCEASGVAASKIEINGNGSGAGMTDAASGTSDLGMASRAVKDSELAQGLTAKEIALDGIAIIVNTANPVENLTLANLKAIYTDEVKSWSDLGVQF